MSVHSIKGRCLSLYLPCLVIPTKALACVRQQKTKVLREKATVKRGRLKAGSHYGVNLLRPAADSCVANIWKFFLLFATQPSPLRQSLRPATRDNSHILLFPSMDGWPSRYGKDVVGDTRHIV